MKLVTDLLDELLQLEILEVPRESCVDLILKKFVHFLGPLAHVMLHFVDYRYDCFEYPDEERHVLEDRFFDDLDNVKERIAGSLLDFGLFIFEAPEDRVDQLLQVVI